MRRCRTCRSVRWKIIPRTGSPRIRQSITEKMKGPATKLQLAESSYEHENQKSTAPAGWRTRIGASRPRQSRIPQEDNQRAGSRGKTPERGSQTGSPPREETGQSGEGGTDCREKGPGKTGSETAKVRDGK